MCVCVCVCVCPRRLAVVEWMGEEWDVEKRHCYCIVCANVHEWKAWNC